MNSNSSTNRTIFIFVGDPPPPKRPRWRILIIFKTPSMSTDYWYILLLWHFDCTIRTLKRSSRDQYYWQYFRYRVMWTLMYRQYWQTILMTDTNIGYQVISVCLLKTITMARGRQRQFFSIEIVATDDGNQATIPDFRDRDILRDYILVYSYLNCGTFVWRNIRIETKKKKKKSCL